MAQRPQVAHIPEQLHVPAVCDHMIDVRGLDVSSLLHALLAKRVRFQEFLSRNLPGMSVAASGG